MVSDDDLPLRDTARHQALWMLAGLNPGVSRAANALVILGDIESRFFQAKRSAEEGAR